MRHDLFEYVYCLMISLNTFHGHSIISIPWISNLLNPIFEKEKEQLQCCIEFSMMGLVGTQWAWIFIRGRWGCGGGIDNFGPDFWF
jgi:hypothetical protein